MLEGQQFLSSDFLIYPPFFQYLLAGWLKFAGISTKSLLCFFHLCYALGGFALSLLLARNADVTSARWTWPPILHLCLLATLGTAGLRPDAPGFVLLFSGLLFLPSANPIIRGLGWMLVGSALLTSPNVLPYAVLLSLARLCLQPKPGHELRQQFLPLACAIVAVFLMFHAAIGGRWMEFHRAFSHHATRAVLPPLESLTLGVSRYFGVSGKPWPLTIVCLAVFCITLWFAWELKLPRPLRARRIQILLGTWLLAGVLSVVMTWLRAELRLFTLLLGASICVLWLATLSLPRWIALAFGVLLGLTSLYQQDAVAPRWHPKMQPSRGSIEEARRYSQQHPERLLLIDSRVARSVFDYRFPARVRDWSFSRPFPALYPTSREQIAPDETWIITGIKLRLADTSFLRFEPLYTFGGISLNRYCTDEQIFIVEGSTP
jgi:hypothetical protein